MRIRKHAARILSSPSIPSKSCAPAAAAAAAVGRERETHVCELNQSPWDVMAFTPRGGVPLYRYQMPLQVEEDVEEEKGFAAGATLSGQSEEEAAAALSDISGITAAGSTSTRRANVEQNTAQGAEDEQKRERKKRTANHNTKKIKRKTTSSGAAEAAEDENKVNMEVEAGAAATEVVLTAACKKSDGKGWHCKREAQRPHSLCEYHLTQVRSYYINGGSTAHLLQQNIKKNKTKNNGNRTGKPEPDFFYYYSGFGPWRRKRRSGDDRDGGDRKPCDVDASKDDGDGNGASDTDGAPPPIRVHDQAPDDLDVDDDDTDDVDDVGSFEGFDVAASKGGGRKPIKARSLKSLL